jgi:hypothetical protein
MPSFAAEKNLKFTGLQEFLKIYRI